MQKLIKFSKISEFNQISGNQPNIRKSTKFQEINQILTIFQNFNQMSGNQPNLRILTKFSERQANFTISTNFQNFDQISDFLLNF